MIEIENITQKDIESFYNQYKYNSDLIIKLERRLMRESFSYEKWQKMLKQNSDLTRKLYKQNNELIENFSTAVIKSPQSLSKDSIKSYLLYIAFFIFENRIDSAVTMDIIDAFLKKNCVTSTQDKFEAYLSASICSSVQKHEFSDKSSELFDKATQEYFNLKEFSNVNYKTKFILCQIIQILDLSMQEEPNLQFILKRITELSTLIESITDNHLLENMWGENKDYQMHKNLIIRYLRYNFLFAVYQSNFETLDYSCSNSILDSFIQYLNDEFNLQSSEEHKNCMIFALYYKFMYKTGKITLEEYKTNLENIYNDFILNGVLNFSYPENFLLVDDEPTCYSFAKVLDTVKILCNSFNFVFFFMQDLLFVTDNKNIKDQIINNTIKYFSKMPFSAKGTIIDKFILPVMINIMNIMNSTDEILNFLMILFVRRQISTAIHSTMVSNIASFCAKKILTTDPDFFGSQWESQEELLDFIKCSAICHDIGKIYCSDTINLHFRKITNNEFETIKHHPKKGSLIVQKIPALSKFADIIEGHHKFYDGTFGYPKKFDNTKSQYRTIIDLITICDCIDAATDILGRNYAKGKSFVEVLKELREQSGTRYNPQIVEYIANDTELINQITEFTTEGRKDVYYETYNQYVKPHTDFTSEDEKVVTEIEENDYENILSFFQTYWNNNSEKVENYIKNIFSPKNFKGFLFKDQKNKIYAVAFGRFFEAIENSKIEKNTYFIDTFIVDSNYRRQGIGSLFLAEIEEKLQSLQTQKIIINIPKDLRSESFYWINGFSSSELFQMGKDL